MRRRSTRAASVLGPHIRCVVFALSYSHALTSPIQSFFPHHLGGRRTQKTRTLLIHSSTRPACTSNVAHIMTYTIHPTCAQYSRYPPMRPHGLRRTSPGRPVAPHRRVGHKNWGDVQAALAAVTSSSPPQLVLVPQRWLTPLVELTRRPVGSPPHPEGQIEESVSVHINDFANSEPVYRAWVEGRKNLWVHRLIYEPETSRPRDLKRYEVLAGLNMKREIKKTR